MLRFLPLAILLATSCFSGLGGIPSVQSGATGSFSVTSKTFGDQTLTPSDCASGDRQFFLGGDFSSSTSPLVLRLAVDPVSGPAVRLFSADAPWEHSIVFRRSDCAAFHFTLDSTGWRINDVYDYRFTLQLDCRRAGEAISGSASSAHCH